MRRIYSYTASILTDASGDATVYLGTVIHGQVKAICYTPGTIATGASLVFTGETSGVPILTKADAGTSVVWFFPRAVANKHTDGSAFTDESADLVVAGERIKLVVASGGDGGAGSVTVYTEEDARG